MAKGIEARLQTKIISYLKSRDFVVIKMAAMPGIPTGIPDVLFLRRGGGWGFIEVKASPTARFQPLQKEWLAKLDDMCWARVAYPENWDAVKLEIDNMV